MNFAKSAQPAFFYLRSYNICPYNFAQFSNSSDKSGGQLSLTSIEKIGSDRNPGSLKNLESNWISFNKRKNNGGTGFTLQGVYTFTLHIFFFSAKLLCALFHSKPVARMLYRTGFIPRTQPGSLIERWKSLEERE